jgi:hypothetical protein
MLLEQNLYKKKLTLIKSYTMYSKSVKIRIYRDVLVERLYEKEL